MKKIMFFAYYFLAISFSISAQVGIGTTVPMATLDISGNATTPTVVDGILTPRLTGDQLKDKDAVYTISQEGAMVYITAAVGTASAKTVNVTEVGYYFFDGTLWHKVKSTKTTTYKGGANMYLTSINAATGEVTTINETVGDAVTPNTDGTFTVAITGAYVIHIKPTSTGTGQCRLGINDGTGNYRNINYFWHYGNSNLESAGSSNVITLNSGTTYRIQTPTNTTHQECSMTSTLSEARNVYSFVSIYFLAEL